MNNEHVERRFRNLLNDIYFLAGILINPKNNQLLSTPDHLFRQKLMILRLEW